MVPTKYGQVETRLFCPQPDSPATLFYLHGGGFILGNLDTHDRIMRLLASYSQCTVIGIDYTLSPEARFPQAIEEIVAACCYFHQQAEDYQINMSRIGFAGDSAGAMLALASSSYGIGRFTAFKAEQILAGGLPPGEIPVETLKRFSVIINMPVVRELEFYPPLGLLNFAEVIDQ